MNAKKLDMTPEQLEFAISQFADGTLAPELVDQVKSVIAVDAAAAAMLASDQKLTELFSKLPGVPEMDWDRLATRFSNSVGVQSRPSHSSWQYRGLMGVAAAAVLGVGIFLAGPFRHGTSLPQVSVTGHSSTSQPAEPSTVLVQGPRAETPGGPSVLNITVNAPAGEAGYARGVNADLRQNTGVAIAPTHGSPSPK